MRNEKIMIKRGGQKITKVLFQGAVYWRSYYVQQATLQGMVILKHIIH